MQSRMPNAAMILPAVIPALQILLLDPSGNVVELFQPAASRPT